jgi:hypothetical protein
MGRFAQPCLKCGKLTGGSSRCETCQKILDQAHDARRAAVKKQTGQYSGSYQAKAKAVREAAISCWICGEGARVNDPWQADHVNPGEYGSDAVLLPAHASCNRRRGNKSL